MKIKVDHVTNSSSEAFGVVIADSALVIGAGLMLGALFQGCSMSKETGSDYGDYVEPVETGDSQAMADAIAKGVMEDAQKQEQIVKDAYDEAGKALDDAQKALLAKADEIMANYQFVAYTPCIEAGVDINITHFDKIFIILSGGSTSQRGLNQMIARIRQLKDNNVHVFLNDIPCNIKSFKHLNIYELKNYYHNLNNKNKAENNNDLYFNGQRINKLLEDNFTLYETINMIYNEQ
jgi:hypothetical protein